MKNIAFIYSGAEDGLESLTPNRNMIKEKLLQSSIWEEPISKELQNIGEFRTDLATYQNDNIENLLFYYTGHGEREGIKDIELFLRLSGEDPRNIQEFISVIFKTFKSSTHKPKRIAIVIDACFSGTFASTEELFGATFEILTSSLPYQKSSGVAENSDLSLFTEHFCKAIEYLSPLERSVNLREIKTYINIKVKSQQCTHIGKSGEYDEMVLVPNDYSSKISQIRTILQEHFPESSIEKYREFIFQYLDNQSPKFKEILEAKTVNKLTTLLLLEENCLFCLLKKLNEDTTLVEGVVGDINCDELAQKVEENRHITRMILKIELKNNDLTDAMVSGWKRLNNNQYKPLKSSIESIDFTEGTEKNSYKVKLSEYLVAEFAGKKPMAQMELQLILPYKLFAINFDTLKIKIQILQKWNQAFNISKRFLDNHENYTKEDWVLNWKKNSDKYGDLQESLVNSLELLEIDTIARKDDLDLFNSEGNNYILVTSNHNLSEEEKVMELCYYGIPHSISPLVGEYAIVNNINFTRKKVAEMYASLFSFMKHNRGCPMSFICDDYYDVDFMKSSNSELNNIEEI